MDIHSLDSFKGSKMGAVIIVPRKEKNWYCISKTAGPIKVIKNKRFSEPNSNFVKY